MGAVETASTTVPVITPPDGVGIAVGDATTVAVGVTVAVGDGVGSASVTEAVSVTDLLDPVVLRVSIYVTVNVSPSTAVILLNSVVSPLDTTWIVPTNVPVSTPDSTILTFVLFIEDVWMNTSLNRDSA